MGRAKLPRKSTNIDMTAMCDVAFLLLSFFILTTKFKPAEAIAVTTPSSVAAKIAPDKDLVLITIDKDGNVLVRDNNGFKVDGAGNYVTAESYFLDKKKSDSFKSLFDVSAQRGVGAGNSGQSGNSAITKADLKKSSFGELITRRKSKLNCF